MNYSKIKQLLVGLALSLMVWTGGTPSGRAEDRWEGPGVRHTFDGLEKFRPVWSADGRRLIYASMEPDGGSIHLYQLQVDHPFDATRRQPKRLFPDRDDPEFQAVPSPQSQSPWLAVTRVTRSGTQGDLDLVAFDLTSNPPRSRGIMGNVEGRLSHQEWPNWSADGSKLVFASTHEGNQEIYWIAWSDDPDAPDSQPHRVTRHPGIDTQPCWTPDGQRIVFVTDRWGGLELAITDLEGHRVERLTRQPGIDDSPDVAPDGQSIAFTTFREGMAEVFVMGIDGSNPRNLSRNPEGHDMHPRWTPDGRGVTFCTQRQGRWELVTLAVPTN